MISVGRFSVRKSLIDSVFRFNSDKLIRDMMDISYPEYCGIIPENALKIETSGLGTRLCVMEIKPEFRKYLSETGVELPYPGVKIEVIPHTIETFDDNYIAYGRVMVDITAEQLVWLKLSMD